MTSQVKSLNGINMKDKWYQISSAIEYSGNFNFFLHNQIFVVKRGFHYCFCSRLESKTFLNVDTFALNSDDILKDETILQHIHNIHADIFAGKHGIGKIVN